MTESPSSETRRCAVVVNPIKVSEDFRALVMERLTAAG